MNVNREELLKILTLVRPGLANKEVIEQSNSFVFLDKQVLAYNDTIAISHPIPVKLRGVVKAKELYDLLSKSQDEKIEIKIDKELIVSGKSNKAGMQLEDEVREPLSRAIKEITNTRKKWQTLPKTFVEAVKFCVFSAGSDMTKPVLTCLNITGDRIESCDNYRLTRYMLRSKWKESFLLPATSAELIPRYEPVQCAITKDWAHFLNKDDVVFSCRIADGEYPDLTQYIKGKGESIDMPDHINEILDRASIFAETDLGYSGKVAITLHNGQMVIRGQNQVGWFEEKVRTKYKGDKIQFHINPKFLKEIAAKIKSVIVTDRMLKFVGDDFTHCCVIEIPTEG